MTGSRRPRLAVATSADQLPSGSVWGSGGWDPPEAREARDWVALAALNGWEVDAGRPEELDVRSATWVVVTGGVDSPRRSEIVERCSSSATVIVVRGDDAGGAPVRGRHLSSEAPDPPRDWTSRSDLEARSLSLAGRQSWLALDGHPIVAASRTGRSWLVELGFHPSVARDNAPVMSVVLRDLLVAAAGDVTAVDHAGTVVLRMDDPGAAQSVHSSRWRYRQLDGNAWRDIERVLVRHDASMSVGYVSRWVDDGDVSRGSLLVDGRPVARVPGVLHPSHLVRYKDSGGQVHDYASQAAQLHRMIGRGTVSMEMHGLTHQQPNTAAWAVAPDRYDNRDWYREFGTAAPAGRPATDDRLTLQRARRAIQVEFETTPTTLIFPGDQWDNRAIEAAADDRCAFVSSYYLAVRTPLGLVWSTHCCAPYLDQADSSWFDSGLPVVGYFHDREVSIFGSTWLDDRLEEWRNAGARRFVSFADLATSIAHPWSAPSG